VDDPSVKDRWTRFLIWMLTWFTWRRYSEWFVKFEWQLYKLTDNLNLENHETTIHVSADRFRLKSIQLLSLLRGTSYIYIFIRTAIHFSIRNTVIAHSCTRSTQMLKCPWWMNFGDVVMRGDIDSC
jgi:hypothetical protein